MVTYRNLTLGGKHTRQYSNDDVLQNCTVETYIILLTDVTLKNSKQLKKTELKN